MYSNRLANSKYERPKVTITESIQNKKDIEELLDDFEEIDDDQLCYVNINTLLRYISFDKNKKKELFRFGGLLVKVNPEYVVLAGKNGMKFSAQRYTYNDKGKKIHTTRFFKKIKNESYLKEELQDTKDKAAAYIIEQEEKIIRQEKELEDLKKKLEKIEKKEKSSKK